jgi:HlyD family secretion protein
MKKLLLVMALLWGGGALGVWVWSDARAQRITYRTVTVRRGDIRSTVSATGTIEPEEVVDVGAQVAGRIESFGANPADPSKPISYGSKVEQGTVLARLDTALFKARVDQAKGSVARAEADILQAQAKLKQAERELERAKKLQSRGPGMIAAQDLDVATANHEAARAGLAVCQSALLVARADLEEATVNLGYTTIRSPVKGIILDRRINIGQTVVASLNAPSLFLIAKDLGRMEIWCSVNENDIGSIHEGQAVTFSVSAFPGERFQGRVLQIRLSASMAQNVVTYTVVVTVDNKDGKLLPYLTARVQFEVEARGKALLVPNAALRWQPRAENVVPEERGGFAVRSRRRAAAVGQASAASTEKPEGVLWIRQGDLVRPITVRTGLSDGIFTEIVGDTPKEGTEVVVGASRAESEDDALSILPHTWTENTKK